MARRYGCKWGLPHDPTISHETKSVKWEVCQVCNAKRRWNKSRMGRIDNAEYLKFHARSFAQPGGATNQLFIRLYEPERAIIKI